MQLNWSMQQQSRCRGVFIMYLSWWYSAAVHTIGIWEELCPNLVGQDKLIKLRDLFRMPPYTTINNLQWMRTCPNLIRLFRRVLVRILCAWIYVVGMKSYCCLEGDWYLSRIFFGMSIWYHISICNNQPYHRNWRCILSV